MNILPAEDTLKEIKPVSDDIEERLERLRRKELLPANVLIELCDKVGVVVFAYDHRQKRLFEGKAMFKWFVVQ